MTCFGAQRILGVKFLVGLIWILRMDNHGKKMVTMLQNGGG
jgi:hypothetical protein